MQELGSDRRGRSWDPAGEDVVSVDELVRGKEVPGEELAVGMRWRWWRSSDPTTSSPDSAVRGGAAA